MDSLQWQELERLFFEIADLPEPEQRKRLDIIRESHPHLYEELFRLIQEEQALHPLLKTEPTQLWQGWRDMELVGSAIGHYQLESLLGTGGMGSVFLAKRTDGAFDQEVAIKLVNKDRFSRQRLAYFEQERQILAQFQHPHIARLYDGGVTGAGRPYYIMEYIAGKPIDVYLKEQRLSLRERLVLFLQIGKAVQYAHQQMILHLDLKPANILVDESNQIKLLDFGVARLIQPPLTDSPDTQQASIQPYTLAYAAPEQLQHQPVSIATDIYALGILLYQLLTDVHPFMDRYAEKELLRVAMIDQTPPYPSEIASQSVVEIPYARQLTGDLDVICIKALEKKPEARYDTVTTMMKDIQAYLEGQPISLRKNDWGYHLKKYVKRNQRLVSLVGAAVLVVIALSIFYTIQLAQEKNNALKAAQKSGQVVSLLSNMLTQANPNVSLGKELTASEMLAIGVDQFHQQLQKEPELLAEMYDVLGSIYLDRGAYSMAESLFTVSMGLKDSLYPQLTSAHISSYYNLGNTYNRMGAFDSAQYYLFKALEEGEPFETDNMYNKADIYYELSVIAGENGNHVKSDSLLQLTLTHRDRPIAEPDSFDALIWLSRGINSRKLGQYDTAAYYYQLSLDLRRELYPEVHPEVAHSLNHLSSLYQEMEQYDQALVFANQSLKIRKQVFGREHPETLASWANLARTYSRSGDYPQALQNYDSVKLYMGKILGEDHYYYAGILGSIGGVHMKMGAYDESRDYYEQAVKISLEALPKDHVYQSRSMLGLGNVYMKLEQWEKSAKWLSEALRIRLLTAEAQDPEIAHIQTNLGTCLLQLNQLSQADSLYQLAYQTFEQDTATYSAELSELLTLMQNP